MVGEAGLEPATTGLEVPSGPFSPVYDWLLSSYFVKYLKPSMG